ncbi:MAG: hypothetical protein ABWZ79_05900 [Pedobacter agri]
MTEFRDVYNYFLRNTTNTQTQARFKIAKPDMIMNNLDGKKMRIQKFYLNNTGVPLFIPNRVTNTSYFNVTTDATATQYLFDTFTSNSLEYYIILRDQANTNATVVFLQQPTNINFGATQPSTPILDDNLYYQNRYYYYYDFTHFLQVIVDSFNAAFAVNPAAAGNPVEPILWQNKSGYFQLFVRNEADWYFEFSESLIRLLPFKNIQIANGIYRLVFSDTPATINGNTYNEVDADMYDTIFPFAQLIFRSEDSNLNPVNFVDEGVLTSNLSGGIFEKSILTYDIETNNPSGIYNFYKYVNEDDSLWVNFYNNRNINNHFTIDLFLRLKNNLLIPYPINPGELCTFSVEIKYQK